MRDNTQMLEWYARQGYERRDMPGVSPGYRMVKVRPAEQSRTEEVIDSEQRVSFLVGRLEFLREVFVGMSAPIKKELKGYGQST